MDCFTDFYERFEAMTAVSEPGLDENRDAHIDEMTSDLSEGITEEYFEKVDYASKRKAPFVKEKLPQFSAGRQRRSIDSYILMHGSIEWHIKDAYLCTK